MKNALIIHGTKGYPEENWFPWLKKKLEASGYQVTVPQFPTPQNQTPDHWFEVLQPYQKNFNDETILIGHSCGGAFLLRILEAIETKIKAAIFVATPIGIPPIKYAEVDMPFTSQLFDWDKIKSAAEHFFVFHSDNDPNVGLVNGEKIAEKLNVDLIQVSGAGHFNAKAGYTEFELLLKKLESVL